MKHVSIFALSAIMLTQFGAHAAPVLNSNSSGIITNNIIAMQHSVMLNTMHNFGSATNLGAYSDYKTPRDPHEKCPPIYGKMRPYGEYGDDGTVFESGRSGGEEPALSNYNWFDWQHAQDNVEFKDFDKIKSRYDIISMGFANEPKSIDGGYKQFGGFGGLIIANEKADDIKASELGGFLGLQQGYHLYGFNITAAADLGALFSESKSTPSKYSFSNFWLGAGLNASYDIEITDAFVLQPGVYGGYTWIYSTGYQSDTGSDISIDSLNSFELSPSLRAITGFGNGWYATLSGRYVFNFDSGGDAKIAGATIPELELMDYAEYGIGIEKNTNRFGIGVSLNRRDGGRTGWIGELNIKYIF